MPSVEMFRTMSSTWSNFCVPIRTPFQAAPMQNRVDPLARAAFARSITIAVSMSFSDCTPVL